MTAAARLRLRVVPGARADAVAGRYGDAWKLRVAAKPERGAANDAVVRVLAEALALPAADVTLVSGHGARDKIVELAGITAEEAERRLAATERKDGRP